MFTWREVARLRTQLLLPGEWPIFKTQYLVGLNIGHSLTLIAYLYNALTTVLCMCNIQPYYSLDTVLQSFFTTIYTLDTVLQSCFTTMYTLYTVTHSCFTITLHPKHCLAILLYNLNTPQILSCNLALQPYHTLNTVLHYC